MSIICRGVQRIKIVTTSINCVRSIWEEHDELIVSKKRIIDHPLTTPYFSLCLYNKNKTRIITQLQFLYKLYS